MQTWEQIADDVVAAVFEHDDLDDTRQRALSRAVRQFAAVNGVHERAGLVSIALTIRDAMSAEPEPPPDPRH